MSPTTQEPAPSDTSEPGVWGGHRERRPRPRWLVPVAALLAGLLIGGIAGFALHRPEPEIRTVIRERRVEVTPESCLRALDLAELAVQDLGDAAGVIAEFVSAVTSFDIVRAGELIDEASGIGDRIQEHSTGVLPAINECRQEAQPSG